MKTKFNQNKAGNIAKNAVEYVSVMAAAARRISCSNNVRQLALVNLNFESRFGHFPGPRRRLH